MPRPAAVTPPAKRSKARHPSLGLCKLGDNVVQDPSKFIFLYPGQFLGRTPRVERDDDQSAVEGALYDRSNRDGDDVTAVMSPTSKAPRRRSNRNKTAKGEPKSSGSSKHHRYCTKLDVHIHKVSRKCLQVMTVDDTHIKIQRLQENKTVDPKTGRLLKPFRVRVLVHGDDRYPPPQDLQAHAVRQLEVGDVLQIHTPDPDRAPDRFAHSFVVVRNPGIEDEELQSGPAARKRAARERDDERREMEGFLQKKKKARKTIQVTEPPSFWHPSWAPKDGSEGDDSKTATPPSSSSRCLHDDKDSSVSTRHTDVSNGDMSLSIAQIYMKQLNGSTPHMGAMFLDMALDAPPAPRLLPSLMTCQELLQLVTWGPRTTERAPPRFFWDGPRLRHAMAYYRCLLTHTMMVPRLNEAAPKEWYKTILDDVTLNEHTNDGKGHIKWSDPMMEDVEGSDVDDDDGTAQAKKSEEDDSTEQLFPSILPPKLSRKEKLIKAREEREREEQQAALETLQMQACRLEALTALLKASVVLEREQSTCNHENSGPKHDDSDDTDDETEDEEDEPNKKASLKNDAAKPVLPILEEIREFRAKAALMLVSQTLAHFFVTQLPYLIVGDEAAVSVHDASKLTLRCDLADKIFTQLLDLFQIVKEIVAGATAHDGSQNNHVRVSRRRGRGKSGSGLGTDEVVQILCNAMHLKLQDMTRDENEDDDESDDHNSSSLKIQATDKEELLVSWTVRLRRHMGPDVASRLAQEIGIPEKYGDFFTTDVELFNALQKKN